MAGSELATTVAHPLGTDFQTQIWCWSKSPTSAFVTYGARDLLALATAGQDIAAAVMDIDRFDPIAFVGRRGGH